MKKKVLFVTRAMFYGGVETTLLNLLEQIDYENYDVELHLLDVGGPLLERVPPEVTVRSMGVPYCGRVILEHGTGEGLRLLLREKAYLSAVGLLLLRAVFAAGGRCALYRCLLARSQAGRERFDWVYDYQGNSCLTTMYADRFRDSVRCTWLHAENLRVEPKEMLPVYGRFHHIFGVSRECVENFAAAHPGLDRAKMSVLHNAVPKAQILARAAEAPAVSYDCIDLLSVGRVTAQKGYDLAAEAAKLLKDRGVDFRWVIMGDGPDRALLEAKIREYGLEERLILHGFDPNPFPYMKQAKLYVQPSRVEGFCTTVTEAIVLGKPVVATPFSGIREQVFPGENGFLVDFNAEALADAIEVLLSDGEKRRRFGEASARLCLHDEQTWQKLRALWGKDAARGLR